MIIREDKYFRGKVNDYVYLLRESGYVRDENVLNRIKNQLLDLRINKIHNAPAEVMVNSKGLNVCYENMDKKVDRYGEIYVDEALFHEFSHIVNDFHQSINGNRRFDLTDYMAQRMFSFTTPDLLLASDDLISTQDVREGVLLLDEYIAQRISQDLVSLKARYLYPYQLASYDTRAVLADYKNKSYVTHICEPPVRFETTFATYKEFEATAQNFIQKYGYSNYQDFIRCALSVGGLKKFIDQNQGRVEQMFVDLCNLAIIRNRVYYLSGFSKINDLNDPARDPKKVGIVLRRVLQ